MADMTPYQWQKEKAGVKELLILQYALHEVRHLPRKGAERAPDSFVVPIAHSVSDIYKCLHQGIFGVGHSIRDRADFKRRLAHELDLARATAGEPLLEQVSPDGLVFRINLRPFRALFANDLGQGCELLLQVCMESAAIETGSSARFFAVLDLFRDLNKSGELVAEGQAFVFPQLMVDGFLQEIRQLVLRSGFVPVLSHSPTYRSYNQPSYRVVHWQALMQSPLSPLIQTPGRIDSSNGH